MPLDALSDVLRVMRLKGGVYLQGRYRGDWCLAAQVEREACAPYLGETAHIIPYHYVVSGTVRTRVGNGPEFELGPGASVLFPRNDPHLLGSDLALPAIPARETVRESEDGGLLCCNVGTEGPETLIVCGFLGAEDVRGNPVLGALPPVLRLEARPGGEGDWVRSTFQYAAEQIAAGTTGQAAIMGKLSELLFVEAVQRYAEALPPEQTGWLAALRDPYVSRALALLHARPAAPWTVDALGREAGLSRSALAARFAETMGMPPMQYLAGWRIHLAAQELVHSARTVAAIAEEAGYESEASFSRAFRRVMDAPPAAWRRTRLAGAAATPPAPS